jgi:hypothetical protein
MPVRQDVPLNTTIIGFKEAEARAPRMPWADVERVFLPKRRLQ